MRFARWTFALAGLIGLAMLVPDYFLERKIGMNTPPEITHPEFFSGFVGIGIAWQVAFLIIASDPARFHPLMIPAVLEKFAFGAAAVALTILGRSPAIVAGFGMFDLALGVLFLIAYSRCGRPVADSP